MSMNDINSFITYEMELQMPYCIECIFREALIRAYLKTGNMTNSEGFFA